MQPIQQPDHQPQPAESPVSLDNKPTLATVSDTAKEHGIALSTLYELVNSAPGVVRFGRRIMIHRRIFSEWLEAQAQGNQGGSQ